MALKVADLENYYLITDSTVRESFQQVYDNTRNLQEQADSQEGAVVTLDGRVTTVSEAVGTLESDIEELQPLKTIPAQVEALETKIPDLEESITTMTAQMLLLEGASDKINTLEQTISALTLRVDQAETTIGNLTQRINQLESSSGGSTSGGSTSGGGSTDSGGSTDTTDPPPYNPLPPDLIA